MNRRPRKKGNRVKRERRPLSGLLLHPLLLRAVFIIVVAAAVGLTGVYLYGRAADALVIRNIRVVGNKHFSDEEVMALLRIRRGESMLRISGRELSERVLESPWVRDVAVRKELPHTLIVRLREAEPLALLNRNGRLYILSRRGDILEELSETIAFLPVIRMDTLREDLLREALKVAAIVREEGFFSDEEVEIVAQRPEDMRLRVGGLTIMIGKGDYRKKLTRLVQLEGEMARRGIPAGYVDLRFARRVIIRPVKGRM